MKVTVKIKAKKVWTLKERKLIKDASAFAMQWFNIGDKVTLTLAGSGDNVFGLSWAKEGRHFVTLNNANNPFILLEVLFHEFTHVWQEIHGLYPEANEVLEAQEDFSHGKYLNLPWEVEAHQKSLLALWDFLGVYLAD